MVKQARKKQKAGRSANPLGSVRLAAPEAEKDDEELRLENLLFGTDPGPSSRPTKDVIIVSEGEDEGEEAGANDIEQLQDSDIFFVDDSVATQTGPAPSFSFNYGSDKGSENSDEDDAEDRADGVTKEDTPATVPTTKKKKRTAWVDPDDATLNVSLATQKRLRKLRDAPDEDTVGGPQYEARLRREFERINPAPDWAAKARKQQRERKRRRVEADGNDREEGSTDDDAAMDGLLGRTDGIVSEGPRTLLEKGVISISRLRDANQSAKAEGEIKVLSFHPSPRVPVLMTASSDRRVRLFNVDGHTNPHLQTIHIPELPITNASFHPNGSTLLLTGPRPFYYTFDLQSGTTSRSPRGLWGFNPANQISQAADMGMEHCAFDPSGSVLAVAGRRGYVHLIDWRSGSAQVFGSVKMNAGVQSLWWNRSPGSDASSELMTLGSDAEVYVWNVGERRCVKRWREEGGYGTTVMSGDANGRYLSIGSRTGLVSVYGENASISSLASTPKTLKTLQNLTTSITTLRFNHDSQLLAIASNVKKDQMRLVHLPSLTAFSNWPTSSTPLGHVTAIDFSPRSEYVAIGNNRGRALLYQLPHYINSY